MNLTEQINGPHIIRSGSSPHEADLAIVSIDFIGTPGSLNQYVMKEYGYPYADLPDKEKLRHGFYGLKGANQKPILFVVTVNGGSTSENLSINLYKTLEEFRGWFRDMKVWIPLMGTGDGGLRLEESYIITVSTINRFLSEYKQDVTFILSLPNDDKGRKLEELTGKTVKLKPLDLKKSIRKQMPERLVKSVQNAVPSINEIIKRIQSGRNRNFWWLNANPDYWTIADFKLGEEQSYTTHNENGNPRRIQEYFFEAKVGDLMIGYQAKKDRKVIALLEITKEAIDRSGDELYFRVIHFFDHQTSWEELSKLQLFSASLVGKNNTGSLFILSYLEFMEIIDTTGLILPRVQKQEQGRVINEPEGKVNEPKEKIELFRLTNNLLKKASIDNDGAQSDKDLLGFENDIRSFASLIALKELKPPLAIALFGKWGSGKSFFMYNLQKRIDFLSLHQGFDEFVEVKKEGTEKEEEPFCKGVAQICFNAWSYMDANLWASLVSNIFEKLEEYITKQSKGTLEQEKVRKVLNEKLSIVSEEKDKALEQRRELVNEKDNLIKEIGELENEKNALLEKTAKEKLDEIYHAIRKKIQLDETLKKELEKYGITPEHLKELSPENIYHEAKSLTRFVQNVLKFSKLQLFLMGLGCLFLIWIAIDPNHFIAKYISLSKGLIVSFFTVIGPLFARFYKSYKQFSHLYEPVMAYRDKFNNELEKGRLEYESKINEANQKLKQKLYELNNKDSKLQNLDEQIKMIEHDMKYSVAGKAFFNFISAKTKDERYDRNLGIISVIRKDFETLSELFRDYNIPENLKGEELKQAEKKKEEQEAFKELFNKPLDRIVLYIDDLDRCPEDRVIEVLEAVNLLMAYPLFVVVVGVDPRWVKNALIKKYTLQFTGIMNNQEHLEKHGVQPIHVTDYLEKIFQIPFHLNEADESGVDKLLDNIFEKQLKEEKKDEIIQQSESSNVEKVVKRTTFKFKKDTPLFDFSKILKENVNTDLMVDTGISFDLSPETKMVRFRPDDLKITKQELEDLKDLAWLVGNNPRSVKRYANMYRLVRAHENLNYTEQSEQQDFLAVMFILGIAIGEHKQAAAAFYKSCFEKPEAGFEEIAEGVLAKYDKKFVQKMGKRVLPALLKKTKGKVFNRYIPFVKRFSFENVS
jgi:hypothetical protein